MTSLAVLAILLSGVLAGPGQAGATGPSHIKHLFIIVLENKNEAVTFANDSEAPYLAKTLTKAGAFLPKYFGVAHESNPNYLAMISGQPPNIDTQADCMFYNDMAPGTIGADGIATGEGCVFPEGVRTVANQLEGAGFSWHGYMQDMANSVASGQPATCRHPAPNAQDHNQTQTPTDQYANKHNPFIYFHSIVDFPTCDANNVDLSLLSSDLKHEGTTPSYSFITPDLCSDGHDGSCLDGGPGGYAGIDAFLKQWVPTIEKSAAYQDRGMLLVTFDESASENSACCNEAQSPNTPNNAGPEPGLGGGQVGAVAVSPCIKPGTVSMTPYNHYSMLRWVEDNFGLPHLANAAQEGLVPFGSDVFTRPGCQERISLRVRPHRAIAGQRTRFKLRIAAQLPRCRQRVRVRFAGHVARTNRKGVARITARLRGRAARVAKVAPAGCKRSRAKVHVLH